MKAASPSQGYVDSGEKRNGVPELRDSRYMVFPRMPPSVRPTTSGNTSRWSNYKGWNEAVSFVSPVDGEERDTSAFELHLSTRILGANMDKAALNRTLNNSTAPLTSASVTRIPEVRSGTEIIVGQGNEARLADLTNAEIRRTLAQMIEDLSQGLNGVEFTPKAWSVR